MQLGLKTPKMSSIPIKNKHKFNSCNAKLALFPGFGGFPCIFQILVLFTICRFPSISSDFPGCGSPPARIKSFNPFPIKTNIFFKSFNATWAQYPKNDTSTLKVPHTYIYIYIYAVKLLTGQVWGFSKLLTGPSQRY